MKPDEAAKVLRDVRRFLSDTLKDEEYESPIAGWIDGVDAAVAALEAVAGAEPVCVGRAKYSRTGGNAGLAWFVEDAIGEHQYRTGSPKDGELLFVLPAACAKCKEKTSTSANNDREDDAA